MLHLSFSIKEYNARWSQLCSRIWSYRCTGGMSSIIGKHFKCVTGNGLNFDLWTFMKKGGAKWANSAKRGAVTQCYMWGSFGRYIWLLFKSMSCDLYRGQTCTKQVLKTNLNSYFTHPFQICNWSNLFFKM